MPEALIVRVPSVKAIVDLLKNYCQLERAEDLVIPKVRHVQTGSLRISVHDLIAREPAISGSDGIDRTKTRGRRPVAERQSQIHQRIAGGCHLPIEHGFHAAWVSPVQHQIVQFVIIMDERGPLRNRKLPGKPANHELHRWNLFGFGVIPTIGPAAHLPFEKAIGLAERCKPIRREVNVVQVNQTIDEAFTDSSRIRWGRLRWNGVAQDDPMPAFHDKEDGPDHSRVFTQMENARSLRKRRVNGAKDIVLARHVVCFRRNRAEWRAPQHVLRVVRSYQISQIGVAGRELLDCNAVFRALNFPAKVSGKAAEIQFLSGTNRRGIRHGHRTYLTCSSASLKRRPLASTLRERARLHRDTDSADFRSSPRSASPKPAAYWRRAEDPSPRERECARHRHPPSCESF